MSNKKKKNEEIQNELEIEEILSRSEKFIEKNKKKILYAIIGITVIVGLGLTYHYAYSLPNTKKANVAIFKGEQYLGMDSFQLALHGNGKDYDGFETIIDQYGRTKAGNLAKAYAGVCYYKLGDPEKAIRSLKSFNGKDDQITPSITGLIGDCHVTMGNVKEGISFFEKAASKANNDLISPIYLKKAGIAYESQKQYNEAIKAYQKIKEDYYHSREASDIDKYIARAELLSKQ